MIEVAANQPSVRAEEKKRSSTSMPVHLQQDEVVAWCNSSFAVGFPGLPPASADVGDLENLVLGEADLVGVIRIGLVTVNGLGSVRVFRGSIDVGLWLGPAGAVAKARLHGVALINARRSTGVAGNW